MVTVRDQGRSPRRSRVWDGAALKAQFDAASTQRPWSLGYRSVGSDLQRSSLIVEGTVPGDLRGTFFRNGPARHELGGQRYAHRWDGDGMVHAFNFADDGVSHQGRFVQTRKHKVETAEGRFIAAAFGTPIPGPGIDADALVLANPANINVVRFGDELLALWEAGPAYRLDAATLATRGVKVWSEDLRHAPFSAHPKSDSDGTLWNFGVDPISEGIILYHAHPSEGLIATYELPVQGVPPVHDFAVTARHLVFLLPSMSLDKDRLLSGGAFGECIQWTPSDGMRVLVLRKGETQTKEMRLPPGVLFHVAQAFDGDDETIVVDYMRADTPMSLFAGWTVMRGEYRHSPGSRLTRATLNLRRSEASEETVSSTESEFPVCFKPSPGNESVPTICVERTASRDPGTPGFDQVAYLDLPRGTHRSYNYGASWLVEEHVPVPRTPWLVGTALDMATGRTAVNVLDSRNLEGGPVARAWLQMALPLGLHGFFDRSALDVTGRS